MGTNQRALPLGILSKTMHIVLQFCRSAVNSKGNIFAV
jgi:hypothetical protein